jgi:recombination protein RecA
MATTPAERARDRLLASFSKSYGPSVMTVKTDRDFEAISTGSIALDQAMYTGGYLVGRLTEVWGPPAGGKSSLALVGLGNAQRQFPDRYGIYVDVEHTYDPVWARTLGVDTSRVLHIDPLTAENVADMVKDAIRSDAASMMIIDSIGAVLTNNEFEKAASESDMGKRAQVVSRMINIAAGLAPRHGVAPVIINQARANFGFGLDTKPSGGFVPAHSMTQRLNVKRASAAYTIGSDDTKVNVGYEMGVKVERNKVGPEGRNVKFDFITVSHIDTKSGAHMPVGIDKVQEAVNLGIREGVISQAGAWLTLPNGERFQGRDAAKEYLRQQPDQVAAIRERVMSEAVKAVVMDGLPELTAEQAREVDL